MGRDLVESLKKDKINPFETILGWLWPSLWDQLLAFGNQDNDDDKSDSNDNCSKYTSLRVFSTKNTMCHYGYGTAQCHDNMDKQCELK